MLLCCYSAATAQGLLGRSAAATVQSRREAMLWLWRAHNEVWGQGLGTNDGARSHQPHLRGLCSCT